MSQLPNHMIPRINSIGEKNREKQLMLQLPRQDLSVAYCKHLKTPIERRLYEEFVNARNEIALDIGFISVNIPKAMVRNRNFSNVYFAIACYISCEKGPR